MLPVPAAAEAPVQDEHDMRLLARRFMFRMMDERAAQAARLIAEGAPYWTSGGGNLVVARSATILTLSRREAGQIHALLGVTPQQQPQVLRPEQIEPTLRGWMAGLARGMWEVASHRQPDAPTAKPASMRPAAG